MKHRLKLLKLNAVLFLVRVQLLIDDTKRFFRQLTCKHELAKMSEKSHWKCNRDNKIKVVCELCNKKFYRTGKELLNYE